MIERIAYSDPDDDRLAQIIGQWIVEEHRRCPGRRICTGFMVDDYEVSVGIFGFAHGDSESELAKARRSGKANRTWRRVFPGRGGDPESGRL